MELFFLKLVGLLRPIASMTYAESLFEVLGIGIFGLVVAAVLVTVAIRKELALSAIDLMILAFVGWCLAGYAIYFDVDKTSDLAQLLIPMLTFVLVKNVVRGRREYQNMLSWIIVGFAIAAVLSAGLIAIGHPSAIDMVMYWTGVTRWEGAYTHSHNLGHTMTLFLMILVLYATIRAPVEGAWSRLGKVEAGALIALAGLALYCLFMSQVRSAILGLLVFLAIYSYSVSKKLFIYGGTILTVIAIVTMPLWFGILLHELSPERVGGAQDITELGSGRLDGWRNDIAVFTALPFDQKMAGVGIGVTDTAAGELFGHNDWLRILTDTGIVGLLIFLAVQLLFLNAIRNLAAPQRYVYLALFIAVNVMMAVSNSYTLRIQVSQVYYMVLAFVQIPALHTVKKPSPRRTLIHAR